MKVMIEDDLVKVGPLEVEVGSSFIAVALRGDGRVVSPSGKVAPLGHLTNIIILSVWSKYIWVGSGDEDPE